MKTFTLSLRFLKREWRSGELLTLAISLILAVTAVLTVSLVTDRLTAGITHQSAELTGGDLVIESTRPPDDNWQLLSATYGLSSTRIMLFDSVLFAGDEMQLASVKAVVDSYPLLGQLESRDTRDGVSTATSEIPAPGTAWADPRLLDQLKISIGDEIHFGSITLKLTSLVTYEPDQGGSLFQFAPRLLVNQHDLDAAEVLGPGSRIRYRSLFVGAQASQFAEALAPTLAVGHRLITPADEENRAAVALTKATQYIRLATLLTLILAAIAIALTARRYAERHKDTGAMLRCLGAHHRQVSTMFVCQLLLITIAACTIAAVIGWLGHELIVALLSPLLAAPLPPPTSTPWLVASASAVLLVIGFALPPLLRLADTPPLRVLRRELNPPPPSVWLAYGITAISQCSLLLILFQDIARILGILLLAGAVVVLLGWLLHSALTKLRHLSRGRQSLLARSLRNLAAHPVTSASQILAFSLTLMLMILLTHLRGDLLKEWQLQLPEDAPNHFAFNLLPHQTEGFVNEVGKTATLQPLYPVIRGRIDSVNGSKEAVSAAGDDRRELNFTWTDTLPEDNEVTAGTWPPVGAGISMEENYAKRLGAEVGDTLEININGDIFPVTVSSLRSVQWESFRPNFYLIFSREQLANQPTTYLTSFHTQGDSRQLLKTLSQRFPSLMVIEIDNVIARMTSILNQISLAIELVLLFVLLGGFAVLFATLQSTLDDRIKEGALLRSLGASRRFMKRAYLAEFGLIGLVSGIIAVAGADVCTALIYSKGFDLVFTPSPLLWLLLPPAVAIVVATAGYSASRKIMTTSPKLLLAVD